MFLQLPDLLLHSLHIRISPHRSYNLAGSKQSVCAFPLFHGKQAVSPTDEIKKMFRIFSVQLLHGLIAIGISGTLYLNVQAAESIIICDSKLYHIIAFCSGQNCNAVFCLQIRTTRRYHPDLV